MKVASGRGVFARCGDARVLRRAWGLMTVGWIVMIPIAHLTGWVNSKVFISDLSLIALVLAAGAMWQGSRTEVRQEQMQDKQQRRGDADV